MGHERFERNEEVQGSSNRAFGLVFATVFAVIGLLPLFNARAPHLWPMLVAAALVVVSFTVPTLLAPLNRLWMRFGMLLHRIVSPVVLGIMFFGVVTPIGLLMRALGKDPLRLKFDKSAATYWIDRVPPGPAPESLKDQF